MRSSHLIPLAIAAAVSIFISKPIHKEVITSEIKYLEPMHNEVIYTDKMVRSNVFFNSHGVKCHAWLFKSVKAQNSSQPVVIMGHGLGAQKDFGLTKYAEYFTKKGLAVLAIDYRNFGGSNGEPRNLINPFSHVEDWKNAVRFVRSGGLGQEAKGDKIGLWGTSMAGGHVLVTAAQEEGISAVVSQIPHLNGRDSSKRNIKKRGVLRVMLTVGLALQDFLRGLIGLPPFQIKIIGHEDELSLMPSTDDEYDAYFAKHPKHKLGNWKNQAPARFILSLPRYNPEDFLDKVKCNVLLIGAESDALCPFEYIQRAKDKLGDRAELLAIKETGHFAMYSGKALETAATRAASFFAQNLAEP